MRNNRWHTLFWDLDGTITDPRRGIVDSYIQLLTESGLQVPSEAELLWVIGPPLRDCLATLLKTNDPRRVEDAVTRYRYWYVEQGFMYRDTPYEGIKELLDDVKSAGYRMFVATAKAHPYARLILRHWGLEDYFENIHGSELDGTRSNKATLLKWITEHYQMDANHDILMIGDREHDAIAAKKNNLSSMGVGYGYGSHDELTAAGIDCYCASVADLRGALIRI